MFELYKKRDLSANFSDTTTFFKTFGKHYFKNYFIINGIFLMVLVVLIYFISKIYMEAIFSNLSNVDTNQPFLLDFFYNNIILIIVAFIITFLLIVILSMLNISYPVIYLKLFEKNNSDNFETQEIINGLKANIGKMIVFFLGSIFIILPLSIVIFGLLFLLCFILIGIPLLFIVGSAFLSWTTLSYYEYTLKDVGYFTALKNGFKLVKQQFWIVVGTTFLVLMLVQIVQGIITIIPYIISMIWMFSSSGTPGWNTQIDTFSTMGILVAVIFVLSVLMSYFFNNFFIVNQGIMYYGLQEEKENNSTKSQIDLIGTDFE